jgi:hypothetical protein
MTVVDKGSNSKSCNECAEEAILELLDFYDPPYQVVCDSRSEPILPNLKNMHTQL